MGDLTEIGRNIYGRPAQLDARAAQWWQLWLPRFQLDHPDIPIRIVQALGRATASAGTHSDGWAVDLETLRLSYTQILTIVAHARRYGASGTWYRTAADGFRYPHIHMAIDSGGIPTACQYQCAAARRGRNGLANNGPDPHSAPSRWLTYLEGIALLTAIKEINVPLTTAEIDLIADKTAAAVWAATFGADTAGQRLARAADMDSRVWAATFNGVTAGQRLAHAAVQTTATEGIRAVAVQLDSLAQQVARLTALVENTDAPAHTN